jgi:hypothetical protein
VNGLFCRRKTIVLLIPATLIVAAVTYAAVTYQTPYGCDSTGVATGAGIDWQVLAKPCIYIYFTGIVGGSVLLILLIPVPDRNARSESTVQKQQSELVDTNQGPLDIAEKKMSPNGLWHAKRASQPASLYFGSWM